MNIFDVKNIDKTKEIVEILKENENVVDGTRERGICNAYSG